MVGAERVGGSVRGVVEGEGGRDAGRGAVRGGGARRGLAGPGAWMPRRP